MYIKSLLLWLNTAHFSAPTICPSGWWGRGKKWQTFQSAGADMQSDSKAKEKVAATAAEMLIKLPRGIQRKCVQSIKRLRQRTWLVQRTGSCFFLGCDGSFVIAIVMLLEFSLLRLLSSAALEVRLISHSKTQLTSLLQIKLHDAQIF